MAKCLTYYATRSKLGWPIPGTLRSYKDRPHSCRNGLCDLYEIPSKTHVLAANEVRVYHPHNLHFFVGIDDNGNVLPNSLVSATTRPPHSDCLIEVIKYITVPVVTPPATTTTTTTTP